MTVPSGAIDTWTERCRYDGWMNGIATVVPDDSVALPFKDLIAFGLDTLPIGYIPPLLLPLPLPNGRVTESYSGENVGHRPGERAAVLPRATIGITEIAIRFQNEITLAATITPRPRTMRDDRRPPTLRNCTELSTAPRVSARAFPVDANLRDLARLHAGHGAILRFNQSLGYGKLFRHPAAVCRGVGGFRVA